MEINLSHQTGLSVGILIARSGRHTMVGLAKLIQLGIHAVNTLLTIRILFINLGRRRVLETSLHYYQAS